MNKGWRMGESDEDGSGAGCRGNCHAQAFLLSIV